MAELYSIVYLNHNFCIHLSTDGHSSCFHILAIINNALMNPRVEKAMAPHSSTLAWKIPWMEEPDRLQSMGSLGVGQDWATSLSLLTFMHSRRQWQPTPVFLSIESRGRGAWWAAICGVTQSLTRLKWLSSSSRVNISFLTSVFIFFENKKQKSICWIFWYFYF